MKFQKNDFWIKHSLQQTGAFGSDMEPKLIILITSNVYGYLGMAERNLLFMHALLTMSSKYSVLKSVPVKKTLFTMKEAELPWTYIHFKGMGHKFSLD